uniref:Uncharacterized protein n=1 Tax=Anopheles dirus TaxID=7168 RepID=A0A182NXB1_9DIPT
MSSFFGLERFCCAHSQQNALPRIRSLIGLRRTRSLFFRCMRTCWIVFFFILFCLQRGLKYKHAQVLENKTPSLKPASLLVSACLHLSSTRALANS